MPSFGNIVFSKYTPLALSEYAIDLAASSVFFRASTVLISGFGAPAFTAMPMNDRAISTRLPFAASPDSIVLSSA